MATSGQPPSQAEVDRGLREAVKESRWEDVITIVHSCDCSQDQRHWAIRKVITRATDTHLEKILDGCSEDQMDWLFADLLRRRHWECITNVLIQHSGRGWHRRAVEAALSHLSEEKFADYVLCRCTEEELQPVLRYMVYQGLWGLVDSDSVSVKEHILSQLVSRGLWNALHRFAQLQFSGEQRSRVMQQASPHVERRMLQTVFSAGSSKDNHIVLSQLVSFGLWELVGEVLEQGVGTSRHEWAVQQACEHAEEGPFTAFILHHCTAQQLQEVSTCMAARGLWHTVDNGTHDDVSITQHILSQLLSRGLWAGVGRFVQRDVSSDQHRWAVEQASQYAGLHDFADHILPQCADEELKHVLPHLVWRGLWGAVGQVLERGVSDTQHSWAVDQASQHAGDRDFVLSISDQCHDKERHLAIDHLVSRGLWRSVGKVLEQGVSAAQHSWAVDEASQRAGDEVFVGHILPQCHDEDLERVITPLVSRGLWKSAGKVLERGVGHTQHSWAVEQASEHADERQFAMNMLHHCTEEQLQPVATYMVSRQLWTPVDNASHSITQHVLSRLVARGMWEAVGRFLQQDLSLYQHRRAVCQASQHAGNVDFAFYILPQCGKEDREHALTHLLSRSMWWLVGQMLQLGVSVAQHREAVVEASQNADDDSFHDFILRHCSEDDTVAVFPHIVANRKWKCTKRILYDVAYDTLHTWLTLEWDWRQPDTLFWKFIHICRVDVSLALTLSTIVTVDMQHEGRFMFGLNTVISKLATQHSCLKPLCESLVVTLLHTLCSVVCTDDMEYTDITEHTRQSVSNVYSHITECIQDNTGVVQQNTLKMIKNQRQWTAVFTEVANAHKPDPLFVFHFLQGLNLYYTNRRGENDDATLLVIFAVFPLFPQLQSTALRMMLREKRWDVISQACLSHVWEHDRRQLFKAAVEQKQWRIVRQWADHTVHDDQRDWAMKEAFRKKQWKVYLLLADHGLTMREHMHACYIVAKYGDWGTVLQMVERGGDITEVSNLLETWVTGNLRLKPQGDSTVFLERCKKLIRLRLRFERNSTRSPMKSLQHCLWGSVLFNILHKPTEEYFSQVLHKVIEEQEWHILMHLVRLGMNKAERDWLFPQMVRQQQWGVCRKLLEISVDVQLCQEALPELMEKNQWTLVARVMEYSVDDAVRCQMAQYAFQRREGVLFWHCLTTLENQEQLSVETRVKLFNQAISRDIWQAVKPLVEEKDVPGIKCRDMAFLIAIEQHLWDVVDYCQLQGADINMEDRNGETPLHREARKKEWQAVEEIVFRDGKPNLLDRLDISVLNRLIDHKQWDSVKFVIKYGGDIHLPAICSEEKLQVLTPLQALINKRQADIIHFTIMWCPEQRKGLNKRGETVLHAVCDSDRWDVMEDLMIRQVDPLVVTETGQTALVYAVLNTQCPQRMVAECCRLGFSSHQPALTGDHESLLHDIIDIYIRTMSPWKPPRLLDYADLQHSVITSPLVCAVLRDSSVVIRMLFESGSCSHTDLFTLCTQLWKLTDMKTEEGLTLLDRLSQQISRRPEYTEEWIACGGRLVAAIEESIAFMMQLASTPRSLLSSCRLVILRHFHFRDKKRQQHLQELPLSVPLKNYLEFSDFMEADRTRLQYLQKLPQWRTLKNYLEFFDCSCGQHLVLLPPSLLNEPVIKDIDDDDDDDDDDQVVIPVELQNVSSSFRPETHYAFVSVFKKIIDAFTDRDNHVTIRYVAPKREWPGHSEADEDEH